MTSSTICSHHRIRTVLLMCVVLLSASLHAQAQNKETRINLNIRNATLESFVKQLENVTGFSFIYGEEVKLTHRITLEMKQKNISETATFREGESLTEILDLLKDAGNFTYKKENNTIILTTKLN